MKKYFFLYLFICIHFSLMAQTPSAFSYQGVAMDKAGKVIANQQLAVQISIVQGQHDGEILYTEVHQATTTENGQFTLAVGRGVVTAGQFSEINWGTDQHFIGISMDVTGGNNYQFIGSTELLSVPYAFHANVSGNRQGPIGLAGAIGATGPPGTVTVLPPDACCPFGGIKGPTGKEGPPGRDGATGPQGKSGLANLKKTATIPSNPQNGRIYLDDGTNRGDGKAGLRYFDINQWVDL